MKKRFIMSLGLIWLFLIGCSSIQTYQNFEPIEFGKYKVSNGAQLYTLTVSQDLPNAFGNADIYGGKVKKSYSQLTYLGVSSNNFPIFNYYKVFFESNETTMSRYGKTSATVNTNNYGSFQQSNITVYSPPKGSTVALEPNSYTFEFNNLSSNIINVDDVSIEIISFDSNALIYSINKGKTQTREKL